jgi:hypothetical protein
MALRRNAFLEKQDETQIYISLLRHCATSRRVDGSIPDGVIGIFHSLNPTGRPVALRSTQPVTEMSTRHVSWG